MDGFSTQGRRPPMLSVVTPAYDEEEVLPLFLARLRPVLDSLGCHYEVIVVDDGSQDGTADVVRSLASGWDQISLARLRRNSGHQAALTAGLDVSSGDWVITLDCDLQDPPELIPKMLSTATIKRVDVVYAVRDGRAHDTWFKRQTARAYYSLMDRSTGASLTRNAGDFRLMSREVVRALEALPERRRVYRLLVPWLGFPSASLTYDRPERAAGHTKYPLHRMMTLGFDSLTAFSSAPLRVATWTGVGTALLCLALTGFALAAYALGATVPGWTSVFVAVLFVGAVQLICIGLLGEYIGRVFVEVQSRPLYSLADDSTCASPPPSARPVRTKSAIRSGNPRDRPPDLW